MDRDQLYEKLLQYARKQGIDLNADAEWARDLVAALLTNEQRYGYRSCPCRLAKNDKAKDKDIVCPCVYRDPDIKEFGSCYCGLYVSNEWNQGRVQHVRVPERRPLEMR